jgi:hypothetical protein
MIVSPSRSASRQAARDTTIVFGLHRARVERFRIVVTQQQLAVLQRKHPWR